MKSIRSLACALTACSLIASGVAAAHPAGLIHVEDYGLGAFATIAAWQAAGGSTAAAQTEIMDYGMGAYASIDAWQAAGATAPRVLASTARY